MENGVLDYAMKPLLPDDLVKIVKENLAKSGLPEGPPAQKKIMVVDDAVDTVDYLTFLLTGNGYEVVSANDGPEALAKLAGDPRKPDLILLDIMMPKMSGWEVLARIRSNPDHNTMKIIFLSAKKPSVSEGGAGDLYSMYLLKPIEDEVLLAKIKSVLGQK
jgi:CheY-like chemotaxis protein